MRPRYTTRARRLTARARAALAIVAVVGSSVSLSTVLPAAAAETAGPRLVAVGGDHTVSVSWGAVEGTTRWRAQLGTTRTFTSARATVTSDESVSFGGLRNGRAYWVRVQPADGSAGGTSVRVVPSAGYPRAVSGVQARPGAANDEIRVSWAAGGRARRVAVVAGSSPGTGDHTFHSAWYPASVHAITLRVPTRLRAVLGGATGNPVFVKVVQVNSGSTTFRTASNGRTAFRASPKGRWTFAKAVSPVESVTRLDVAAYNVQSLTATTHFSPVNRWAARAQRVANAVNAVHPDILLTSELSTTKLDDCTDRPGAGQPYRCRDHSQLADLAHRLDGLRLADDDAYDRVLDRTRSDRAWMGKVTAGAHVFYDPSSLTLLDHGFFSPAMRPSESFADVQGLGVPGWTGAKPLGADRWLSWARLQTRDAAATTFYAVAAHLPSEYEPSVVAVRRAEAVALMQAVDRLAGDLPVVLGGDLNSDPLRKTTPIQRMFVQHGWFDSAAVGDRALRTGMLVSTSNGNGPQTGDAGYNASPIRYPYPTSRIDYILLRGSPHTYRYANVVRTRRDGTFVPGLKGSDHNLQLATVGIRSAGP